MLKGVSPRIAWDSMPMSIGLQSGMTASARVCVSVNITPSKWGGRALGMGMGGG
jgi:hypothetical protein